MGIIFNGRPLFTGKVTAKLPTKSYSGKASADPKTSINPYTNIGPKGFQKGDTEESITLVQKELDKKGDKE